MEVKSIRKKNAFFPSNGRVDFNTRIHQMDSDQVSSEKSSRELHKNTTSHNEQILEATSHKAAVVRLLTSRLKNHPNKTEKTRYTVGEVRTNS